MTRTVSKTNLAWLLTILAISCAGAGIGNWVRHTSILGGIILVLFLLSLPLGIELLRKRDPIEYYGLELSTLKRINIGLVLSIGVGIFVILSLVDGMVFHLWEVLKNVEGSGVGGTSLALAKSNLFYLAVVVIFSGTLLEELWFRGFIQYKLRGIKALRKINPHFAILVQSTLFGLAHFLPVYFATHWSLSLKIWFFVYPFLVGLLLGYLNEKYRSLWPGWIVHYTNNLLAVFLLRAIVR